MTHNNAVELDSLTKYFGNTTAVNSANFNIYSGECFGLLGPNGAGKSTLINMLVGLASPSDGSAKVLSKDIVREYTKVHAHIGFAPTEGNFDLEFNVLENLYFHAGYFGVPRKNRESKAEKYLRMFDLWGKRKVKTFSLSSGMRKKLLLARAMISDPDILILDEPTAGLDVETRKYVHRYIRELNLEGLTIVLTTHQIGEAEELCERVAIMDEGSIVAMGSPDELMKKGKSDLVKIRLSGKLEALPRPLSLNDYQVEFREADNELRVMASNGGRAAADTLEELFKEDISVESVDIERASLEDVFTRLTKKRGE